MKCTKHFKRSSDVKKMFQMQKKNCFDVKGLKMFEMGRVVKVEMKIALYVDTN